MPNYYVIMHNWSDASDEDVENFPISNCLKDNYVCMQYEYGIQKFNQAITERWNKFKNIKEGDVLFLRGRNKIYAWGHAIKPRFNLSLNQEIVNCQNIIDNKQHDYRSDTYNGYVKFGDCEVFYENLMDRKTKWGQRVDVDQWRNYNTDIYDTGGLAIEGSSQSPIKPITKETAEKLITQLSGQQFIFSEVQMNKYRDLSKISSILEQKKQIILQGAPGTGKNICYC